MVGSFPVSSDREGTEPPAAERSDARGDEQVQLVVSARDEVHAQPGGVVDYRDRNAEDHEDQPVTLWPVGRIRITGTRGV